MFSKQGQGKNGHVCYLLISDENYGLILKERYRELLLRLWKNMAPGEGKIMNYMNCIRVIKSSTLKFIDQHGQDIWCVWTIKYIRSGAYEQ